MVLYAYAQHLKEPSRSFAKDLNWRTDFKHGRFGGFYENELDDATKIVYVNPRCEHTVLKEKKAAPQDE